MQKQAKLIVSFVRYHYVPHMILTALFILLAGAILSFRNLDAQGAAKVVEMYGVLSGTLLLTPLFMPESDPEIWQLEQSKAFGMWKLYLGRFAVAVALLAAVMGSFTLRLSMGLPCLMPGCCGAADAVRRCFWGVSGILPQR